MVNIKAYLISSASSDRVSGLFIVGQELFCPVK